MKEIMNKISYWTKKALLLMTVLLPLLPAVTMSAKAADFSEFAGPVLKTNEGGVYTETNWDLDLLNHQYTKPADDPVPPGDVFAPAFSGAVKERCPVISSYTRQTKPDRSFVLEGANFTSYTGNDAGKDTRVWVYRQTAEGDARLYHPGILNASATTITATIDAGEPYGMYMVWVENAEGTSYPVRINGANTWWIGPKHGQPGSAVSIYGRNLSRNDGTAESYVYLRPWGAGASVPSVPAEVTGVNPNKITFTVPQGLASGQDYEVWVHNGHGGSYGWTGPQKLYVEAASPYQWNGTVRNVTDYGANAADADNDDSAAIIAAIKEAVDGDVIYFPSGTYKLVASKINVTKSLYFQGENRNNTTIFVDSNYGQTEMFYVTGFPHKFSGLKLKDEHTTGGPKLINANGNAINPVPQGSIMDNCIFEVGEHGGTFGTYPVNYNWCNDIVFTNNIVLAPGGFFTKGCRQVMVAGNSFTGNWVVSKVQGPQMIFTTSSHEVDIHSNTIASLDNTGDMTDGMRISHRGIQTQSPSGMPSRYYIGDNNLSYGGHFEYNAGERILFEATAVYYTGSPIAVSNTVMTFSDPNWAPDVYAEDKENEFETGAKKCAVIGIHDGKGVGQYRRIIANTSDTVTIDRPWDIEPDASSKITINAGVEAAAIYNNTASGMPNYGNQENATCGVELFGGAENVVISKNNISSTSYGIYLMGLNGNNEVPNSNTTQFDIQVNDNKIDNVLYGIAVYAIPKKADTGPIPGVVTMNNVIRDNLISNVHRGPSIPTLGGYGFIVGAQYKHWTDGVAWYGDWVKNIVFENNTVTDAANGYAYLRKYQGGTVLRNNTFTDTNAFEGTTGLKFDGRGGNIYSFHNTYDANIDTKYGMNKPQDFQENNKMFYSGTTQADKKVITNSGTNGTNGAVKVVVDGQVLAFSDQAPLIVNGRTLVPMRAIFERLGAQIEWKDEIQTVVARIKDCTIQLQVGSDSALKNGSGIALDVAAQVINGRTVVPLRFVGEALGAEVQWVESTGTVEITTMK